VQIPSVHYHSGNGKCEHRHNTLALCQKTPGCVQSRRKSIQNKKKEYILKDKCYFCDKPKGPQYMFTHVAGRPRSWPQFATRVWHHRINCQRDLWASGREQDITSTPAERSSLLRLLRCVQTIALTLRKPHLPSTTHQLARTRAQTPPEQPLTAPRPLRDPHVDLPLS